MRFKINNRFKSLFGCLLIVGLLFATPSIATQQDSVVAETTAEAPSTEPAGVEAAVADRTATEDAAAETATVSTSSSTSSVSAAAEEETTIDPQVYKNFTYYVLLFLVVCTIVAVVLKVISIYELTRKMNGQYNPLANNNIQATLFIVFLVLFLAFIYYGYSVWGAWAWKPAATEHGKDIDTMFIVTTVIITFVLVVVHILLLSFSYIYRMRLNRKAYYYPHNDAIERLWTIVPAVVLTILVLFGFFTWRKITNIPEELQKSAL